MRQTQNTYICKHCNKIQKKPTRTPWDDIKICWECYFGEGGVKESWCSGCKERTNDKYWLENVLKLFGETRSYRLAAKGRACQKCIDSVT